MNNIKPYERRVYYYETDKMGIMHHSNYIRIFEEARVSYMQQAGLPFENVEEMGLMMPVLSVECKYKHSLRFDEPFKVYLSIEKFNGTVIEMSYEIISCTTKLLSAQGMTSHCFMGQDMKPVRIRNKFPELYEFFNSYLGYKISRKN